jgi:hypothetical protein
VSTSSAAWNFSFGEYVRRVLLFFLLAILLLLRLYGARFGRRSTPQSRHVQLLGLISLLANPLALITAWLVLTGSGAVEGERRLVQYLAVLVTALGALAILAKPLPGFEQSNASVILFFLPAHLGLVIGVLQLEGHERSEVSE